MYLPRVDEAPQALASAEDRGPPPNGTETPVRAFVARVLRQQGYTVFEAGRAEEAVRWLGVADHAAVLRPGIRVLFVSGYPAETLARRGIIVGGAPLLGKPFSAAALAHTVRDVLDAPSPPAARRR